jgi:hypothetical protein
MLSFLLLPKGVLSRLDFFQSRFFWQGDSEKKKYRLAKWSMVCRPKDQGGLIRLLTEDGIWQTLLRRKYVGSKALSHVFWKPGDSHFWAGLMATKKHFLTMENFRLRMALRYLFGRIGGLVLLHSENTIRHCMLLCVIRVIQLPIFWSLTIQT